MRERQWTSAAASERPRKASSYSGQAARPSGRRANARRRPPVSATSTVLLSDSFAHDSISSTLWRRRAACERQWRDHCNPRPLLSFDRRSRHASSNRVFLVQLHRHARAGGRGAPRTCPKRRRRRIREDDRRRRRPHARGHGRALHRQPRPRLRPDDDPAPPGSNRHGARRAALRQGPASEAAGAGDHRRSATGDRGDAGGARRSSPTGRGSADADCTSRAGGALIVTRSIAFLFPVALLAGGAFAGQPPYAATAPDVSISSRDRVYAAEQFSNTVSVIDPASNRLVGVIRLGDPQPANLSPLYRGQLLVHGLGLSPDHRTLVVVSIGSNSATFIDTATNAVKHVTYLGRSPHEAFFTPDGREVWVTVRGEDYVAVLDGKTFSEKSRIKLANGPGMTIFSPDGKYGYVCSSFNPETAIVSVADHKVVGRVKQESPFCPNISAAPEGDQVWLTLKDVGKVMVFGAKPPFKVLKVLETGPITNHVNLVRNANGQFAYVTVGGLNKVLAFRTDSFEQVAEIPVGELPHGLWPSGDGTRVYVGIENGDAMTAIDTLQNKVVATIPIGQGPQAVVYVPNAVPEGAGTENLVPLGTAGRVTQLELGPPGGAAATRVSLFDQGLTQVLQAAVTGLEPKKPYVLALSS